MCTVCGCGQGHQHAKPYLQLGRALAAESEHTHPQHLHFGENPAGVTVPGLSSRRVLEIEQDVLSVNNRVAQQNRGWLAARQIFALNLVSSPGSGKTTLLVQTLLQLQNQLSLAVIEGDQQTEFDAERIRATGVPAVQINTGKGCHLDALMVQQALSRLPLPEQSVLLVENVGNLVCPAGFDLGEAHKVVLLSVTEGEDKPLKYPDMFAAADVMVLTKMDLLPYVPFDVTRCLDFARRVNPKLQIFQVSSTTGEGMSAWLDWIRGRGY